MYESLSHDLTRLSTGNIVSATWTIDKTPDEGSDTADFIEELRELSNLHFKATTPAPTTHAPASQAPPPATKAGSPAQHPSAATAEPELETAPKP